MKKNKSKIPEEPWVKVKAEAYYKMLVHVLRFGSKVRTQSQYKEVMGILVGHLEGESEIKNVIVDDAIPISHGGAVEVAFAPEDYAKFSTIDEQLANENRFSVGWYHSHPGLKIFFSSTDVVNQLGWQTQWNPSGIGIVFDHTYLENENDLGFRTFRLDDPSKGQASGYHEVNTIVEPPKTTEFYNKIIELINSVHTKEPPILERNEKLDILGRVEFPDNEQLILSIGKINSEVISSSIKEALFSILETLTQPLIEYFNTWSGSLINDLSNLNLAMKDNLIKTKTAINNQMNQIQNFMKSNLDSKLNTLDDKIYGKLESLNSEINKIIEVLESNKENLEQTTQTKLKSILQKKLTEYNDVLEKGKDNLNNISASSNQILNTITSHSEKLQRVNEMIENAQKDTIKEFDSIKNDSEQVYESKIQGVKTQIKAINESISTMKDQLDEVLLIVKDSINHVQERIKNLEEKKSKLHNNLNEEKEKKLELQDELHDIKERKMELQNNLNMVKEDKIKLQNNLNTTNEEKMELQTSLSEMREEIDTLRSELENRTEERNKLNQKIESLQDENKELINKGKELKKRGEKE